jgi:twitching motility protein PilT
MITVSYHFTYHFTMAALDELFQVMIKEGASDLHIAPNYSPFFRINGHMIKIKTAVLSPEKSEKLVLETMSNEQSSLFKRRQELDWSYQLGGVARFRANAFVQVDGVGAVYRLIPSKIKTFKELGLPDILSVLADQPKGLILATGPTGSGKSTTLAALIQHINTTRKEHIITIEDPIEYVHKGINCLINQREVFRHTRSFAGALRAALREDPDVIMVGEMRDLKTISLTLTAAETGHLVFATLHTNSAAKSIDRIIDSFPPEQQPQARVMLSESLVGVVAQTLLPRADHKGMIPAMEVMIATSAIRNLIRENKTYQIPSVIQTSSRKGMITFDSSVNALVAQGLVAPAAAAGFLPTVNEPGA